MTGLLQQACLLKTCITLQAMPYELNNQLAHSVAEVLGRLPARGDTDALQVLTPARQPC